MNLSIRFSFFAFLLFILINPVGVHSQRDTSGSQDSVAIAAPQPIPVISVISEMEEVRQLVDNAETQLIPRKSLATIDSLIPTYDSIIAERKIKVRNLINTNPNRQDVEDYIITWRSYRSLLRGNMTSINSYLTRLSILEEDITSRTQVWKLTLDVAKEQEAPKRIVSSIEEVLVDLELIDNAISDQNNHYLQLESHIDDQIAEVNFVIGELELLRDSEVFNLFYLRNSPLWKSSPEVESDSEAFHSAKETFSDNLSAIGAMLISGENTLYLFVLLLLILIGIVLIVRRSFINFEFQAATNRLAHARELIVKQPVLVTAFVAVLVFWYLFTNTPKLFDDITVLLMLLIGAVLIHPFLHKKFKTVPHSVILVVIIRIIKSYILLSNFQYRLYSLAEALLILGLVIYFTRPFSDVKKIPLGKVSKTLLNLTPLLYLFATVAIISNLLGYTNLTALALRACSQGIDLSFIVFTLAIVADSIIIGLVHHRFRRLSILEPIKKMDLERKVSRFISLTAWILWLYFFLVTVDLYRPVSEALERSLSFPYKVGTITFTLGMLVTFIGILAISFVITSLISFLLDGKEVRFNFLSLPKGIPSAISMVIRYFILAVGFVLAISS